MCTTIESTGLTVEQILEMSHMELSAWFVHNTDKNPFGILNAVINLKVEAGDAEYAKRLFSKDSSWVSE